MTDTDELLDISQAARFLNVSEMSLRRWTNSGQLPCLRVGGRRERRFRRDDLLRFLEEQSAGDGRTAGTGPRHERRSVLIDGEEVRHGTHLCGFFDSDATRIQMMLDFMKGGFSPESAIMVLTEPAVRNALMRRLTKIRPAIQEDVKAGRFLLAEYERTIAKQLELWRRELGKILEAGAQSVRVIGDISGFAQHLSASALVEYEIAYTEQIAAHYPTVTICQYGVRDFSSKELLNALQGHPHIFSYPAKRLVG